jgi:hypothetical protein
MMGGVIAATVLTLTYLPALYALAFRVALPSRDQTQPVDVSSSALGVAARVAGGRVSIADIWVSRTHT